MGCQRSEPAEPGSTYVRSLISFAISAIGGELQSASSRKEEGKKKILSKLGAQHFLARGLLANWRGSRRPMTGQNGVDMSWITVLEGCWLA